MNEEKVIVEERNTFSVMDVIYNLLFITLFVFILLWLFPSKSFITSAMDKSTAGLNKGMNALTEQIFNQNITTMKDAAISYFTTPRLPKKVGQKVTLTLKEMRDKNLILSLIDKNGNQCDEGYSYVEITKMDDEYVLKVFLGCSDKEDYILVHLGCYDYCDGDVCEKKEETKYRYEYALATSCKWTGWSAWSNWTTTYVAPTNNRKVETKVMEDRVNASFTTKYSCEDGYTFNETDKKCYKTTGGVESIPAEEKKTYTCPDDTYTLNGTMCEKTFTLSAISKTNYTCPDNTYTLNGTTCEKNETVNALAHTNYVCPDSTYTLNGTTCTKIASVAKESYVISKVCPSGYNPDGSRCSKTVSGTDSTSMGSVTRDVCSTTNVLDCSSGRCKTVPKRTCTTKTYRSCPGGYEASGNSCVRSYSYKDYKDYIYTYGTRCPAGTTGANCLKTFTQAATAKTTYSCADSTYTLNGTKCSGVAKIKATQNVTKSCPVGYEFNANKTACTFTAHITASESNKLSCKDGYVLNDKNVCVRSTAVTDVKEAKRETVYSCPATYTKEGNTCVRKVTYYRFSTRDCVGGSVDYKWSFSNNDQTLIEKGYKLTGKKEVATTK